MKNFVVTLISAILLCGHLPLAEAQNLGTLRGLKQLSRDALTVVEITNNVKELAVYFDTVGYYTQMGYYPTVDPLLMDEEGEELPQAKFAVNESAGSVHPNALQLDVDYCGSFSFGAAVVKRMTNLPLLIVVVIS